MCRAILTSLALASSVATGKAETPVRIRVDTGTIVREVRLDQLLGGNIALWYQPEQLTSPALRERFSEWQPGLLRLPGGSWSDEFIWNGNGIRSGDRIDISKFVAGRWNIDYSGYAPGFRLQADPAKPGAVRLADYHGNLDVRALHQFARDRGARAVVTANLGTGTPEMAAEWLRWTKQEGYNVAYWELGNELDGEWELGHIMPDGKRMTEADYARRFREFATALKAVDPAAKVGGPACSNDRLQFVETLLREAGDILDFISFHTYPVLANDSSESQRFAQADDVKQAVEKIHGWIRQHCPAREGKIGIGVTEWHKQVMETRETVDLSSGLWACIFVGAMAESAVSFANCWDCFSQTDTGGHGLFGGPAFTPRAIFHALSLWRNHMHGSLLPCHGGDSTLRAFATRSGGDIALMLVNTSPDSARKVAVNLGLRQVTETVRAARLSAREYFWDPHHKRPRWSLPPAEVDLTNEADGTCLVPAFSAVVLKFPPQPSASAPPPAPGEPDLALALPATSPADQPVEGFVLVRLKGQDLPWQGTVAQTTLTLSGPATLDRTHCDTSGSVASFRVRPTGPGRCVITASAGPLTTSALLEFTANEERPEILWSFSDDTAIQGMETTYQLAVDRQIRPNQAVAAVTLDRAVAAPQNNTLLAIHAVPAALDRKRIGGVVARAGVSPDFTCADPAAAVQIVLQSNHDHWIPLGTVPLRDLASGKARITLRNNSPAFLAAMPELYALRFMLDTKQPVTGTVWFDDVGFLLRSR